MSNNIISSLLRMATLLTGLLLLTATASAHHLPSIDKHVVIKRIEVPFEAQQQALMQLAMHREVQAVKVAVQRQHALKVSHISWSPEKVVVIGHRIVHKHHSGQRASMWLEEVRVTVPRQHLANTWDVHSLQKELERLGIKVKPKPGTPKPTQQISG